MRVVLVSTYDLGRQPFGLASPAAWLRAAGHDVHCMDLAVDEVDDAALTRAHVVAFHLPMHAATRGAVRLVPRVKRLNPTARLVGYGLYAPGNAALLRTLGVEAAIGGEYEGALVEFVDGTSAGASEAVRVERGRLAFRTPERSDLPSLERYARLELPDGSVRLAGATEASRGCKHRCRHCPIVPVYDGRFRIVPQDVVLEDVRQQIRAGATHVTFGDPDFWNGIGHAVPLVRRLHAEHPQVSYDVTIKIEHLLQHREHLATLRETGCVLVTSAVESLDDAVLARLDKGHTRAGFLEALALCRAAGLALQPTFIPFMPWTSAAGYRDLLRTVEALDLVEQVAPVQLALRLLIVAGSRLLELPEIKRRVGPFDPAALVHPWAHADPAIDRLQREVMAVVESGAREGASRSRVFERIARLAGVRRAPRSGPAPEASRFRLPPVPRLTEPWYC